MAQPNVDSRPATWAGTSGPILYKFTSTNYSNAGYYMAVEVWDNVAAAKVADAKYYANSSGALTVDISAFLKSNMSLNNTADLTSGTVYEDGNWINYYIKYQEIWTASSESKVDDVANLRYAIYGGVQLGVVNDFTDYISGPSSQKSLSLPDTFTSIVDINFLVSIISYIEGLTLSYERFLNGVSLSTVTEALTGDLACYLIRIKETGTADKIVMKLTSLMALSVDGVGITSYYINIIYGGAGSPGTAWTLGAFPYVDPAGSTVTLTTNTTSQYTVLGGLNAAAGIAHSLTLEWDTTATTSTKTYTVYVVFLDASDNEITYDSYSTTATIGANVTASHTFTITSSEFIPKVGVRVKVDAFGSGAFAARMHRFTPPVAVEWIESKTINIIPECPNTIVLQWRNSLGGVECFPFTYNQEYTFHYSDRKAKRLTLFADQLTLSQWEAIQGLKTLGDIYKTPIVEMTTALNRTSATIGQSVYVLNSDGTKIGVNVINTSDITNTDRVLHSAVVEIEYPELFLQ